MYRSKILGGLALAALMLAMLTGCPSIIANIVGSTESIQQALNAATAGDTIKILGTHKEDVTIEIDNLTIMGQHAASIDGNVTVKGNNVTLTDITITGKLDTLPGSFNNLTLDNVTIQGWNTTVSGTFSCDKILQPGGDIKDFVDNASAGESLCVAPNTYTGTIDITKSLTLTGFSAPTSAAPAHVQGRINLEEDGITLQRFKISQGAGSEVNGIFIGDATGYTDDAGKRIKILNNFIESIASTVNKSAHALQAKSYDTGTAINGLDIKGNIIKNVSESSKGAVGIKIQADVNDVTIWNNTIDTLDGGWNWGITLTYSSGESGLPDNVSIIGNTFTNLMDPGGAIGLETGGKTDADLPLADQVTVHQNNFSDFAAGICGVVNTNQDSQDIDVDAENNWWDAADGPSGEGSGSGVCVSEFVDFEPFADSPF